ncbi:MAG: hypothetical protein AABY93_14255 [Bacteroidota bacterium]
MSLTVTFKDVGHGDSILIEWDSTRKHIGVIDCNKLGASNPVLDYISINNFKEIDFLVLSHPHLDHYSGFGDLLKYCQTNGVIINKFCFTILSQYTAIIQSNESLHDFIEFAKLLESIDACFRKKVILDIVELDSTTKDFILTKNIKIETLAPSYQDKKSLIDTNKKKQPHKKLSKAVDFNKVATFFKLSITDKRQYILFTSDVTRGVIKTIMSKKKVDSAEKILLGQVPHHGSKLNHAPQFWTSLNKDENSIAVFSCGQSPIHSLPDEPVVSDFKKFKYEIHSTNSVNGILNLVSSTLKGASHLLDFVSTYGGTASISATSNLVGDQKFTF